MGQDNLQKEENLRCFYCSIEKLCKNTFLLFILTDNSRHEVNKKIKIEAQKYNLGTGFSKGSKDDGLYV